jgi:hypothetical protein
MGYQSGFGLTSVRSLGVRYGREAAIGLPGEEGPLLAQSRWGGWLLLTASECQSVEAIKQPRAKGAIRDAGYYNRP